KVVLRRHRVARGLGVTRQLHVFLGDVVRSPADFHVGTVGFVSPRERILALAVSPPHAFVLTVSHGFWFVFSVVRRPSRRFSPRPPRRANRRVAPVLRLPRHGTASRAAPARQCHNSNTMAVSRPRSSRGVAHPSSCACPQPHAPRPRS